MANGSSGLIGRHLRTLWSAGAIGDAEDWALLTRFSSRRDDTAETAFRILVERHGPMVLRVCRQVLGDGHDAHDAAQAVFLVLARSAGSIRNRGSTAAWLQGVASRVAGKARRRAAVRRANEARAVARRNEADAGVAPSFDDWEALHEEVARLPAKYRAPVVLCYLEGQTYEETARRIGCPVGTVRVRLHRARERLRERLTRRGYGPEIMAPGVPAASNVIPSAWVEATVKAALAFVSGRALDAGAVSASALVLSQGVLRSIMFTKLKLAALGILATGALAAGGHAIVGQEPATKSEPAAPSTKADAKTDTSLRFDPKVDRERELATWLRETSRKRLEAQKAFYEEGRITVDRYVDASRALRDADLNLARDRKERIEAAQGHFERVKDDPDAEKDEGAQGRPRHSCRRRGSRTSQGSRRAWRRSSSAIGRTLRLRGHRAAAQRHRAEARTDHQAPESLDSQRQLPQRGKTRSA